MKKMKISIKIEGGTTMWRESMKTRFSQKLCKIGYKDVTTKKYDDFITVEYNES